MNQANKKKISVIIPVYNEEESIGKVLSDLPKDYLDNIIIVDNGSTDNSAGIAAEHGALVLSETERGYGAACLKGINYPIVFSTKHIFGIFSLNVIFNIFASINL